MTQEEQTQEQNSQPAAQAAIECSMCGRDRGPVASCELCHGNQRFVQTKHYTLSEERQGKGNPDDNRYGEYGEVGPKIVVLPGGALPGSAGPR